MNPFTQTVVEEVAQVAVAGLVPRMAAAAAIGLAIAARPWRAILRKPYPKAEMVQAQILLCVAAAVVVTVIGDSMAKAFGLVGLGSFVRFRSGLKDPRDAAILFLLIGLGMACGHGAYALALGGTILVAVALFVLDLVSTDAPVPQRLSLTAEADDLASTEAALRQTFGARNVVVKSCAMLFDQKRLELEVEEPRPGVLASALRDHPMPFKSLKWAALAQKPTKEESA